MARATVNPKFNWDRMHFQTHAVLLAGFSSLWAEGRSSFLDVGQKPSLVPCHLGLSNMISSKHTSREGKRKNKEVAARERFLAR